MTACSSSRAIWWMRCCCASRRPSRKRTPSASSSRPACPSMRCTGSSACCERSSPRPGGDNRMKITDIRSAVVAGNFDWILVRVYTDEGLTGLGEAYWGPGVRAILAGPRFKEILIGEDPTNVDRCWLKLKKRLAGAGSSFGTLVTAMSGVELALWDLAGKAAGLPIYRLMGGKMRDRIRIYQDCGAE